MSIKPKSLGRLTRGSFWLMSSNGSLSGLFACFQYGFQRKRIGHKCPLFFEMDVEVTGGGCGRGGSPGIVQRDP